MAANRVWEDREIKFDVTNVLVITNHNLIISNNGIKILPHFSHKKLHSGERILEIIDSVEDSKGNAGDVGRIVVSNLRIIWFSLTNPKFTLCKLSKHFRSTAIVDSQNT